MSRLAIITGLGGLALAGSAPALAADPVSGPVALECRLSLRTPNGAFTAPAPVAIRFVASGDSVSDIHVVDKGGILYPGGNMNFVETKDAVKVGAVEVPAERPGTWNGRAEKKMYRLTLQAGASSEAVTIGLGRRPDGKTGRLGLVWNATHQPEGLPQPVSGSGIGDCTTASSKEGIQ